MSDRQLRDEIMTMFLAGHETTAVTLAWTWYLLGQHPSIEARLCTEMDSVLQGRSPTADDVPKLTYCGNVIREALRLFPPAYLIGRKAIEPVEIQGVLIPRGTNVLMSQWVVHRDQRWFSRPTEFLPDRWSDPAVRELPRYAFFPFGGGPRACIGNQFAMLEMVLVLAHLVPRYRVSLCPSQTVVPRPSVTLRPRDGIRVTIQPR
jgi:cytochrome P450